ncbi:uncharacterized protein M6D78_009100 [Vipera latastei]
MVSGGGWGRVGPSRSLCLLAGLGPQPPRPAVPGDRALILPPTFKEGSCCYRENRWSRLAEPCAVAATRPKPALDRVSRCQAEVVGQPCSAALPQVAAPPSWGHHPRKAWPRLLSEKAVSITQEQAKEIGCRRGRHAGRAGRGAGGAGPARDGGREGDAGPQSTPPPERELARTPLCPTKLAGGEPEPCLPLPPDGPSKKSRPSLRARPPQEALGAAPPGLAWPARAEARASRRRLRVLSALPSGRASSASALRLSATPAAPRPRGDDRRRAGPPAAAPAPPPRHPPLPTMVTLEGSPAAPSPEDWTGPGPPSISASGAASASSARTSPESPSLLPPPPPPPPPPALTLVEAAPCEGAAEEPSTRRPVRLRNFNWEAIPAERICGRPNLWTAARRRGDWAPDWRLLEELFGQRPEPGGGGLRAPPATEQAPLLDAKKILNLGIFLKQFKRPVQDIVADIYRGTGAPYGPEKLLELFRMLPDGKEVEKLESFQGDRSRLSEAEVFALLLIQVPSYARRLELLVLKLQLLPQLSALHSAIQTLTKAAMELLGCEELHDLVRLVLKTGNYMNEGGYAGSACGFHVSSLLRLPDTKGNQPGMDLLHFVALEAERKDPGLLHFPQRLQHAAPASRIDDQEVGAELQSLEQRLSAAQGDLEGLGLEAQMGQFLHLAEVELRAVKAAQQGLQQATARLSDFLCEDPEVFSLPECCGIFQAFGERFLMAIEENRAREATMHREQRRRWQQEQAKQKRRSIATCSFQEPGLQDVEMDLLALGAPASGRRSRPPRGPRSSKGSPCGRERPLHLKRRHTLTVLSPCFETLEAVPEAPPPAPPPAPPSRGKKAGFFGQGLKALLSCPPATPASPTSTQGPLSPSSLRLPTLSREKGPESSSSPTSNEVCGLVGFLRRLSVGEKPRSPS